MKTSKFAVIMGVNIEKLQRHGYFGKAKRLKDVTAPDVSQTALHFLTFSVGNTFFRHVANVIRNLLRGNGVQVRHLSTCS